MGLHWLMDDNDGTVLLKEQVSYLNYGTLLTPEQDP